MKSNLPPINIKPTKRQIELAHEELERLVRLPVNYNGMYCVVSSSDRVYPVQAGACHASVIGICPGYPVVVGTVNHTRQNVNRAGYSSPVGRVISKDEYKRVVGRWVRYIVYESFASEFCLSTDDSVLNNGGYVFAADVPSNVLVGALMMTRAPREHYRYVELFWYLTEEMGVHPDIAYMVACNISQSTYVSGGELKNLDGYIAQNSALGPHTHHSPFERVDFNIFKRFIRRNYDMMTGSMYNCTPYIGVSKMFGTFHNETWQDGLAKLIDSKGKPEPEGLKNPFNAASNRALRLTWNKLFNEGGLEILKEKLKP